MSEVDVRPATAEAARQLTDRIKVALEGTWILIQEAYHSRAWDALGYGSWDEYCTREFGTSRLRLPREERQEVVISLRESGMSTRAIAAATGISQGTVQNDLAGEQNYSPAAGNGESPKVTGADGRSYPSRSSSWQPPPDPLPPPDEPEPEPDGQAERLDRLRQMADEAERANPYVPIRELVEIRDALRRAIPKMRALRDAGQSVDADGLTTGITSLYKELEELL